MCISNEQLDKIGYTFPVPRGNKSVSNMDFINAVLYIINNSGKWRGLPEGYGNWHTIYMRAKRWNEKGVLQEVFDLLYESGATKKHFKVARCLPKKKKVIR